VVAARAIGSLYIHIGIYQEAISEKLQADQNAARWFVGEETASFTLRFPSGVPANCSSSYGCARAKRYRLFGSEGWLDLDPATEHHGNRLVIGRDSGREERTVQPGNQFAAEIDHFSACVQEGREPAIFGAMGLQDVRVIETIYRSAESGQPIALP
jgi:predicted dehydrogenase